MKHVIGEIYKKNDRGGRLVVSSALILVFFTLALVPLKIVHFQNEWVNRGYLTALSLFANLCLIYLIWLTVKLSGVSFQKRHFGAVFLIFTAVSIYYVSALRNRDFIYYWDYSNYLVKQYTIEDLFAEDPLKGLWYVIRSMGGDYTTLINVFLEIPFAFTDRTGDSYVLIQLINVFLPLLILMSVLIIKLQSIFQVQSEGTCFYLILSIFAFHPLLHKAALIGQPDWFGLIFCFVIVVLTLDYRFEQQNYLIDVVLFLSTALLILTRRWYLYFVVGYYFSYGLFVVILGLWEYFQGYKEKAFLRLKNIFSFAAASLVMMGILFSVVIFHILRYNYGERYASYMEGGFSGELFSQAHLVGGVFAVLMLAALLYGVIKRYRSDIIFGAVLGFLISVALFTRVQNMGYHQSLLLLPFYYVMIGAGLIGVMETGSAWGKKLKTAAGYGVIFASVFINISGIPTGRLISAVLPVCHLAVDSRTDLPAVMEVAHWIDENCQEGEQAYIIPHTNLYNPDIFRNVTLPDGHLRNKVSYGSAVLGTHKFPLELLEAKYVLTCEPFPKVNSSVKMCEKYDHLFQAVKDEKFSLVRTFDMGNGTEFYAYQRVEAADEAEVEFYLSSLDEEDKRFPDLFRDVLNEYREKMEMQ